MGFHVRDLTITLTPAAPADPGPLGASALDADAESAYDHCARTCECTNCSISCSALTLCTIATVFTDDGGPAVDGVLEALLAELHSALAAGAGRATALRPGPGGTTRPTPAVRR
ncbi:hypothetical protein ACWDRR_41370 [Kitasatospora sp. NPDC003701]